MTIKDVAKRAGVAVGTVSRVINGRPDVNPKLREKVERVIREMNFRPNARAQSLGRNASPIISFILSNRSVLHPFHARVLQGVEEYCAQAGYFVVFARFDYSRDTAVGALRLPGVLQSHGIADCVIAAGTNYGNFLEALDRLGMKYVSLGNNLITAEEQPPVNQVRFDDYGGTVEATRYLIQLGHKDIYFVGDTSLPWCQHRYEAFSKTMREAGLEPHGFTTGLADDHFMNGLNSVSFLLEHNHAMTALFAGNDDVAYGAWEALNRHGLKVPGDVSLIGFDDQYGPRRYPQLTSVRVRTDEVGRELGKMAIEKIRTGAVDIPEVVVPTKLERRGTCRPLPNDVARRKPALQDEIATTSGGT
ncbi:MAG TPA: LacI family DNA-binding transcriptional regulator [Bryobacteraceae bacterium]|nr:LacI family DNA-binding transcriptional regulator [Bryobacteraceae bacterium]